MKTISSISHSNGKYSEGFVDAWSSVVVFSCSLQGEEEDSIVFILEMRMKEIEEFVDDIKSSEYRKEYSQSELSITTHQNCAGFSPPDKTGG